MRILFFSKDAEFNGAQMMLKYLFLKMDKRDFQGEIYINREGKVFDDTGVKIYGPPKREKPSLIERIINKFLRKKHLSDEEFLINYITSIHNNLRPDFWYFNTISNAAILNNLADSLGVPYIVHFHELPFYYSDQTKQGLRKLVTNATLLIGCAEKVCENLRIMGGQRVEKINEFIDFDRIVLDSKIQEDIRKSLNIPDGAFIWAMSGGSYYRKGADLIPQILELFKNEPVHFIWIGNPGDTGYNYFVERSIEAKGSKNIHFVGSRKTDYYDHLAACNGFLLTSREDPFPLVMIEAAAVGKPIVSFDSGGVSEFLLEGMGIVVDSWKITDLTEAMSKVMNNQIGFTPSKAISRAKEFDAAIQVKNWEKIIKSLK